MNPKKIVISGTGCALADYLYTEVRFNSPQFIKYQSRQAGDGGLSPGKLVFTEELEKFSSASYPVILKEISDDQDPNAVNIGGPGLVSLINASQLLRTSDFEVRFYGGTGSDRTSGLIYELTRQTPLNTANFKIISSKLTPFTDVFSDPTYHKGQGERTFVNNIGAAWDYSMGYLNDDFFDSEIVCFGGTALVPQIHDNLTTLLEKAKEKGCITVVNTVFDFRNEKSNPGKPWPLGKTPESLKLIDLLIMDHVEALKISGTGTLEQAAQYFINKNLVSFIITDGANDYYAYSGEGLFRKTGLMRLPVSNKVLEEIRKNPALKGDTTGCGDNFAGGAIASVAWQIRRAGAGNLDFTDTLSWAVASGGFTCYYIGGTFLERHTGEKLKRIQDFRNGYLKQIGSL
jgi:sugar/nucleoside kinase (ribokinase family)